eukprot:CAMPEP_0194204896 /NCGR_PEP_ID=MMETSP0156-20130528/4301_1 /TAXON_ID=33649 /ORGANISM="Thalassionema nitzschioides, Strain L26-B" /LENGTH=34 /DNA_ID= /DNA_START= /DNA_END= /DNA_ORIENTATION=
MTRASYITPTIQNVLNTEIDIFATSITSDLDSVR